MTPFWIKFRDHVSIGYHRMIIFNIRQDWQSHDLSYSIAMKDDRGKAALRMAAGLFFAIRRGLDVRLDIWGSHQKINHRVRLTAPTLHSTEYVPDQLIIGDRPPCLNLFST